MANRFYTILVVPEKTSEVRRLIIPSWVVKSGAIVMSFVILISTVMLIDYWYVMNQISENKTLKLENRRLKQQVQVFQNKMTTVESTLERIRTFATRLKVITNIEDRGGLLQSLNGAKLPDASTNLGQPEKRATASHALDSDSDPDEAVLHREYEQLDSRFSLMNNESLVVEHSLQDLYELLADQKSFLAALPTRKPAVGYFTSGFGVRRSPTSDRVKMHEGLDIANRPGTTIISPADGVVVWAAVKSGYGLTLVIDHGYGLETLYGHTKKIFVEKGQKIRRGEKVALLGNSGLSTGPHVHYEVRVHGTPVDPYNYILEN